MENLVRIIVQNSKYIYQVAQLQGEPERTRNAARICCFLYFKILLTLFSHTSGEGSAGAVM